MHPLSLASLLLLKPYGNHGLWRSLCGAAGRGRAAGHCMVLRHVDMCPNARRRHKTCHHAVLATSSPSLAPLLRRTSGSLAPALCRKPCDQCVLWTRSSPPAPLRCGRSCHRLISRCVEETTSQRRGNQGQRRPVSHSRPPFPQVVLAVTIINVCSKKNFGRDWLGGSGRCAAANARRRCRLAQSRPQSP